MNKFIPLLLGLMLPLAGALADDFVDQAVEFCRSKGGAYSMGSMVEEGDKYCRQVLCKKSTSDKFELKPGDTGPEANVEATKRVCISKSIVDGSFNTQGAGNGTPAGGGGAAGSAAGSASGAASGSASGAASGSASGAASGSASGSASGVASGSAAGAASGSAAGVASGSGSGGDVIVCETLTGSIAVGMGHVCYDACKSAGIWPFKKKGLQRKSCLECLMGIGYKFPESTLRSAGVVIIGGASIEVCKDGQGRIVSRNGNGMCPSGASVSTGGTIGYGHVSGSGNGNGNGNGSTTVTIGTGGNGTGNGNGNGTGVSIGGGVSGGVTLPSYCHSTKQKDIEKCQEWMTANRRFLCASSTNPAICLGGGDADIMARYNTTECVNCAAAGGRRQSTLSGIAEIVGAIAPPLAMFGSAYVGARAQQKSAEAWAGAAAVGFEQCQLSQANYYQYLQANELPGLTPAQQSQMGCNGFGLGGYGGLQNPALGGLYGAGYTPGFVGGMMGPYGGYNPYGGGGYVGGAVGGMAGGYAGGMAGGYVAGGYAAGGYAGGYAAGGYAGGMQGGIVGGGLVGGIQIAGGMAGGGYPGGYAGGIAQGGYAGGYPGGYAGGYPGGYAGGIAQGGYAGGYPGGYAGGIAQGGYAGGYPGGMAGGYAQGGLAGGLVGGIQIAGGMAGGGYPGGYAGGIAQGGYAGGYAQGGYAGGMAGGYAQGGYAGGYGPGGMAGGYAQGGYAGGYMAGGQVGGGYAGGYQGGYQGGYAGGMAGGYAGGYAGGMAGGYQVDAQAANYDRMMQQQGTSYQMGMGGGGGYGGGYGGYGAAGSPMNVGIQLGGSFGIGGGAW